MFENDITITGAHATKLKYINEQLEVFPRYVDVYMAAALVGALNKKTAPKSNDSTDRARIYADVLIRENEKIRKIFKTVILTDATKNWSNEEKINICFKYREKKNESKYLTVTDEEINKMKEALDLFDSYVLAGIDILYDEFTSGKTVLTVNEVIDKEFDMVKAQKITIEAKDKSYDDSQLLRQEF